MNKDFEIEFKEQYKKAEYFREFIKFHIDPNSVLVCNSQIAEKSQLFTKISQGSAQVNKNTSEIMNKYCFSEPYGGATIMICSEEIFVNYIEDCELYSSKRYDPETMRNIIEVIYEENGFTRKGSFKDRFELFTHAECKNKIYLINSRYPHSGAQVIVD